MSLILKGIDMPKHTEYITLKVYTDGTIERVNITSTELDKDAKAIQIPKGHGRLIDADLLKDTIRDSVPAYTIGIKIPTFGDTQIMSAIEVMPTILEAEEQ